MKFRGGEFSTGTMRNFQSELTHCLQLTVGRQRQCCDPALSVVAPQGGASS
jgi:hypothetical protein